MGSLVWNTNDWRLLTLIAFVIVLWLAAVLFGLSAFLLRLHNLRKARRWRRLEDKWLATLPAVLAGEAAPESLAQQVEPGEGLYFVDFLFRNGRTSDHTQRELLGQLARPHLPTILGRITQGDAERRARAVQTVAVLGFEEHARAIVRALDDPAPLVAMTAARALAREDGARFGEVVLAHLPRFGEWSPKFLTSMLVSMGPVGAPVLRRSLAELTLSPHLRAVCAEALGQLRDPSSADVAADVANWTDDADLLAACLRLLRRVGTRAHLPVIRRLADSVDDGVRAQAIGALGRLGEVSDADRLRTALEDPSPWVVIQAARGLRDRGEHDLLWLLAAGADVASEVSLQVLAE